MRAYNERLSRDLERTAWATVEKSWYKNEEGKITNNGSGTTARYWWLVRRANLRDYHLK